MRGSFEREAADCPRSAVHVKAGKGGVVGAQHAAPLRGCLHHLGDAHRHVAAVFRLTYLTLGDLQAAPLAGAAETLIDGAYRLRTPRAPTGREMHGEKVGEPHLQHRVVGDISREAVVKPTTD